jgi:acyl-[acyl-carrier-protein] desaturase
MPQWTQIELLTELQPVVGRELDRHFRSAREWFPHQYVPWNDGRNFDGVLGGDAWDPIAISSE